MQCTEMSALTCMIIITHPPIHHSTVALKALSPSINDPTTAVDALFSQGALVHELLIRKAPHRVRTDSEDRLLLLPKDTTYEDIIALAFGEIRIAAGKKPSE